MNTTQNTRAIDIAWIALLAMTFLMWWADSHAATDVSLLGMALVKGAIIASIFMGLWRTSKLALLLLMFFLTVLGALLVTLLP
jgi:hypothetical protein